MPISQAGALNTTALVVPDLYVQIVPPQTLNLNGVPSNVMGVVGTAQWGPVNQPVIIASMADYARAFGAVQNRLYDAGTQVATAVLQGAQNFRVVRVTDGSDMQATGTIGGATAVALTARYSGTLGNSIIATVSAGSAANSWRVSVGMPNQVPEVFDNLVGTGNALWVAIAAAINNGNGPLRGPSQLVTASAGAATAAPMAGSVTLAGGTDGVAAITSATLMGSDSLRTGIYALRSSGVSVVVVADLTDSTQWSTLASLALSEGFYAIVCFPAGTTITTAISTKAAAGADTYALKVMHGDWLYWNDQTSGTLRLISPTGFAAGRLVNLSPEQSSLNKELYGIAGSQKVGLPGSAINMAYSAAELQALFQAGLDVICNPAPGGAYWAVRCGHNSSSNPATNGDNYTRMTNYIAATLAGGMGIFVGEVENVTLYRRIAATLNAFMQNLMSQGMIGIGLDGSLPWNVVCDLSNNPFSRTSLGYTQADVQVRYLGINERFLVNLQGGQTVTVTQQSKLTA